MIKMTYQEQQEYNKLSNNGKRNYDRIKAESPDWTHSQIITKVKIIEKLDKVIDDGGDVDEPGILQTILMEAREWLVEFCNVGSSILSAIDNAISELGNAIARGIQWIGDKLGDFLNRIFN